MGSSPAAQMDRQHIGVGVIGMGWMGLVHSRSYRALADRFHGSRIGARLVICADEFESRAREARQRLGFEHDTSDWQQVVKHPEVQVVSITAPNHLHVEMVRAAAAEGKHIFCEKPVGRDGGETAAIERAARQAGVFTWVGYNYRWPSLPACWMVRSLLCHWRIAAGMWPRWRLCVLRFGKEGRCACSS